MKAGTKGVPKEGKGGAKKGEIERTEWLADSQLHDIFKMNGGKL